MEVRPGYKQSELGAIPDEWEVKRLGELAHMASGGTPLSSVSAFYGGDIPWVSISDMTNAGKYLTSTERTLTPVGLANSPAREFPAGTVLYAMYASIGECSIAAVPVSTSQAILGIQTTAQLHSEYLYYWLEASKRSVKTHGQQGTQANLNKGIVQDFRLNVPGCAEQRMIATALSDADVLLGGLEELIAKKRDLKHAAMPQLLTGQTRLAGFAGEWDVKRLGDVGYTYGGLTGKTKADFGSGEGQYITFMNVMSKVVVDCRSFDRVRVTPTETQNRVMCGDLLFNGSSETPEEVAMCSLLTEAVPDLYLNSFCFGFRIRHGSPVDGLFLAYLIRSSVGRELMKSLAQGSTRYNLSKSALLHAAIRVPSKDEQAAIAMVLFEMDAGLTALEARREKTRTLKQAMMQELLTGRTRLVPAGGGNA